MLQILLFSFASAQVNLDDRAQVAQFGAAVAANALQYYTGAPGGDGQGAVLPNSSPDASGIQWYESGIYWNAVLDHVRSSKNQQTGNVASTALGLASNGNVGSFLGANSALAAALQGKWNDDILWYALAAVAGAEIYGKDAVMPGGLTFLKVAQNTYDEAWQQWDTTQCGGGIFWSRDRSSSNAAQRGYKSTITNAQHIMLGARLYALTNNATYIANGRLVAQWLRGSGIIKSDSAVADGVTAVGNGCTLNTVELSYKAGMLAGALSLLAQVSSDQEYLSVARSITATALTTFNKNGIISDACEPNCKPNEVQAKGTMISGLGYFATITTNAQDKAQVTGALKASLAAMITNCDSKASCGSYWADRVGGSNFHYQTNALMLVNAYQMAVNGISTDKLSAPKDTSTTKNGASQVSMVSLAALLVISLL